MINEVILDRKILDLIDCNGQWEDEIPVIFICSYKSIHDTIEGYN